MDNKNEKRQSERIHLDGMVEIIVIEKLDKNDQIDDNQAKHDLIDSNNERIEEIFAGEIINVSAGSVLTDKSPSNFGSGGMLIKTDKEIAADIELILTFELPFSRFKEDFALRAKVIRSIKKEDHFEVAVSFEKVLMHYTESKEFDDLNYILNL